jgi:hypothetical protein
MSSKTNKHDILYKNLKTGRLVFRTKDMYRNVSMIGLAHKIKKNKTSIWRAERGVHYDETEANLQRLKSFVDKGRKV